MIGTWYLITIELQESTPPKTLKATTLLRNNSLKENVVCHEHHMIGQFDSYNFVFPVKRHVGNLSTIKKNMYQELIYT